MNATITNKRWAAAAVAGALALALGVFGTVAWLTDTAGPVNNVFSVGNVKIGLTETTTEFKMVPGIDIDKDPVVTVKANSEDAWLFVKVEENASLASYLTYAVDTGWTALADHPGVFYREVASGTADQEFAVLADNKVTVLDSVTSAMMDNITKGTTDAPTLTFSAYAIQKSGFADAAAAWDESGLSGASRAGQCRSRPRKSLRDPRFLAVAPLAAPARSTRGRQLASLGRPG